MYLDCERDCLGKQVRN